MFKNLSANALGVSGRQSEIIELALTYGFRGIDLDFEDFFKRVKNSSLEHARRFIDSAKINIGSFELVLAWRDDDTTFKADLALLNEKAETAKSIGANRCVLHVMPTSNDQPYHENFERHRQRLGEIAAVLERYDIRLGIGFLASKEYRSGQYQFVQQADDLLTLIKTISADNVGLSLDTWHWRLGGGTADQISDLTTDQVVAVSLADAPDDVSPDDLTDKHRRVPGTGGYVDTVSILAALGNIEFSGPVTVCPSEGAFLGMTRDAIVQKTSDLLDQQFEAAGLSRRGTLAPVETPAEV